MEAVAKLNNLPIAPRKVRLVADLIRGTRATQALATLKHTPKKCAVYIEKLLLSAMANWEQKNEEAALEDAELGVKAIWVDGAAMLKRLQAAPQGRAHRIRKRSSHITIVVDSMGTDGGAVLSEDVIEDLTNKTETNTHGEG